MTRRADKREVLKANDLGFAGHSVIREHHDDALGIPGDQIVDHLKDKLVDAADDDPGCGGSTSVPVPSSDFVRYGMEQLGGGWIPGGDS